VCRRGGESETTVHPTITVQAPQPNAELNPGDALTVMGAATGIPGAEPASIDTVIVGLAGQPIEAALTLVAHRPVPTVRFEATVTVRAVLRMGSA
jgi:hypothetical protein